MKNGERDHPGRSSRRLADWSSRMNAGLNRYPGSRQNVSGQRPKTCAKYKKSGNRSGLLMISLGFLLSAFPISAFHLGPMS
jgi:hypothetical protein